MRTAAAVLVAVTLVACGHADSAIGRAEATCLRYRVALAGQTAVLLAGTPVTAGQVDADLVSAGAPAGPWSNLPRGEAAAECSYSTGPVTQAHPPLDLFVDASGHSTPEPAVDISPPEINGP